MGWKNAKQPQKKEHFAKEGPAMYWFQLPKLSGSFKLTELLNSLLWNTLTQTETSRYHDSNPCPPFFFNDMYVVLYHKVAI